MNLQAIREKRSSITDQMKKLNNLALKEQRDLSESELKEFNDFEQELSGLNNLEQRANLIADSERRMATDPNHVRRGNDGTFEQRCNDFSITKAIAAKIDPSVDAGLENEVSQEIAHRSGRKASGIYMPHEVFKEQRAVLTSGTGGNLVPTQHRADMMIDRLREKLKVQSLGATVMSGLTGDQEIPKLNTSATGYWLAEHEDLTRSDHSYSSVSLSPKTVGGEVEYSRRMLINASPAVEQLVRRDLSSIIATAIDFQAINGDGSGNTPTGVLNTSGIGDVSFTGTTDGDIWPNVLSFISQLSTDNALDGSLGWITNPHVVKKLRSTQRIGDLEVMTNPNELAGYGLVQTNHIAGTADGTTPSNMIFGNWEDLLIGYWSAVDILVNPYHNDVYSKGGVLINALQDVDISVRHPESFVATTDWDIAS